MMPRIVPTPIAGGGVPRDGRPRRVAPELVAAALPGPGRDKLGAREVLVVTTGQQPGLFTGPLYTIYKALSAIAVAERLERERKVPVVPVFWVAGDDHDFAEANHAAVVNAAGDLESIVLRERPGGAPQLPLFREPCGPEVTAALERLRASLPDTEFTRGTLDWLAAAYRPEVNLADAFAAALQALLAPRGLVIFPAHASAAKRVAAPWLLKAIPVQLADGLSPVLVEAAEGRDRLRAEAGGFVTRRSGERFSTDLDRIAKHEPERLSPNVLLRPALEAALFPTVAYLAGPGEIGYFPEARPLYAALDPKLEPQPAVARWSGVVIDPKIEKILEKRRLAPEDFGGPEGALEGRLAREALPPEAVAALTDLRATIERGYGRLGAAAAAADPTLERTVQGARNAALGGTHEIEKKLVASVKRENETLMRQLARVRASVRPRNQPQERVLTLASFLARYGPEFVDTLAREVARWAGLP